eukprot:TRINITY_DN1024_c0_g1_i2.p1 TRINITY_DN1024_c0_g1~~TRINITY_DN1024_c0_g1_i2.p1  ORF type:complete len:506 (+),score=167.27 TRINITY_DN1024_c0_g1_i2:36-1520(+)
MAPVFSAPPAGEPEWKLAGKSVGRSKPLPLLIELLTLGALSPVYLFLILPLSVAMQVFNYFVLRPKTTVRTKPSAEEEALHIPEGKLLAHDKRKYDVVLLGATGFTGGLAAKYLGKQYQGGKVKWAIAGRRRDALEKVKAALPNPADADIIIVDTSKEETLHDLVYNTRVVITTAGPFSLYGAPVVRFCAHYGTHYTDIAGEVNFAREMIDRFDVIAKKTGARIVNCCGHDSVPWDLSTYSLVQEARKKDPNAQLKKVVHLNRIVTAPSGGTLAALLNRIFTTDRYEPALPHEPLLNTADQQKSDCELKNKPVLFRYDSGYWQAPAFMAFANSAYVRRSNALNRYGKNVQYEEGQVASGFLSALCQFLEVLVAAAVVAFPPALWAARKYVLPKPGQGPSEKFMNTGFLHITSTAEFEEGSKVKTARSTFFFKTDPGYRDTARMVVEAGLTLALTPKDKLNGGPGVLTPSTGIGMPLVERLCKTGSTYHVTTDAA